jgi:hypothetical protein
MPSYDPTKPTSYITYHDSNNLYRWTMSEPLPTKNFQFIPNPANFNLRTMDADKDVGYILEVDLHYLPELHDAHNLALAPESLIVNEEKQSPYTRELLVRLGLKACGKMTKLPLLMVRVFALSGVEQ